MVTKTAADRRVEIELASLRLMLGDLPELAGEWPELADGERVSWSLDWAQVMGGVQGILDPCYRAGNMSTEQAASYRQLLRQLKDALPLIERLCLQTPAVPLLEGDA